jgi:hypothetical protein
MDHQDFHIGLEFWCAGRQWRCTDVGSRVITAIRLDETDVVTMENGLQSRRTLSREEAETLNWFAGPPYGVAELVFDEDEMEACTSEPDDRFL